MISWFFENYFISQTKNIFNNYPKAIDLTKFILYKTPDIIFKTKSINEIIINDNFPIDDLFTSNDNIKIVTVITKNNTLFNEQVTIHKIANFKNIYSLNHNGIDTICNYVYKNNFLMKLLQKNLPEDITNVNILHNYSFRFSTDDFPIFFPNSVKQIRINVLMHYQSIDLCANICSNLPVNLEKLIICYCDYSKVYLYCEFVDFKKELLNKIKLPFNCELIIEKFMY